MSFFGVGVQPPRPSWGNMLYQAQASMATEPWLALFPAWRSSRPRWPSTGWARRWPHHGQDRSRRVTDDAALRVYAVLDDLALPRAARAPARVHRGRGRAALGRDRRTHCKNLFLRNKKGTRHYLVVAEHRKPVDLRRAADLVGDDRLSFGSPERLMKHSGSRRARSRPSVC